MSQGEPERGADGGAPRPFRTFLLASLVVVLVGAGLLVPQETRLDDPGPFPSDGLEHRLAELDGARLDQAELRRYATRLDAVERACRQSRPRLAELAEGAQRDADAEGARATTLWLLGSVERLAGTGPVDCDDAFAEAARQATWCEPRGERPCGF